MEVKIAKQLIMQANFGLVLMLTIHLTATAITKPKDRIFLKSLANLVPNTEVYHQFVETVLRNKVNDTCLFVRRNGTCVQHIWSQTAQTNSTIPKTTIRNIRAAQTTKKPMQLAKTVIMTALKLLAPKKSNLVERLYENAEVANETAMFKFSLGTLTSNSVLLSNIVHQLSTNGRIQKGTSALTLTMFVVSLIGAIICLVKWCKEYHQTKTERRQVMLEAYYQRRRGLEERRQLALDES